MPVLSGLRMALCEAMARWWACALAIVGLQGSCGTHQVVRDSCLHVAVAVVQSTQQLS
jgi:hypothetical protein